MKNDDDFDDVRPHWWQKWQLTAGLIALSLALGILAWIQYSRASERALQITALEARIKTGPLLAPSDIRTIKVTPSRNGPSSSPQVSLRMAQPPDLIQLRIDVSFTKQNTFRLHIDRKDQGRAGTIQNLLRDSNGELQLAVNTSVLYPGTYVLKLEGLLNRGSPVSAGWVTVQVTE